MTARKAGAIFVLVLGGGGLALAGDDKARSRGSGGSSSQSSSVGERHHSSGSHSSGSSSSSSSASSRGSVESSSPSSSGDRSASAPPLTDAQRRHPRAGTGHGDRLGGYYYGRHYYGYGWPYYYSYYDPYRFSWYDYYWYSGFSPWYSGGYYGYSPYAYRSQRYYRTGSVRVLVEPSKTRVYVDGYYAGVADDFDGLFQRLNLPTGRHEISLKLPGYRTHRLKIYVPLDQTVKIRHEMIRGSGEDVAEDWVGPVSPGRDADDDYARDERYEPEGGIREEDDIDDEDSVPARDRGTLRLEVTPRDASIYVNGQFRGTGRLESLSLPPGHYHVEIVRPGYRILERDVDIEAGRTTRIVAELDHRS